MKQTLYSIEDLKEILNATEYKIKKTMFDNNIEPSATIGNHYLFTEEIVERIRKCLINPN